jgi:hypothetical protein
MAVITGTRYTYSDSVNEAIDMSSALDLLHPSDTPLLLKIGKSSLRDGPAMNTKHEWLEDELRGQTTNDSGGTLNNTTDPVVATVTTNDGAKFRVDDIVKVEDELMRVTAVGTSTITVARGHGGTTNAAHAASVLITLLGPARPQGSDPGAARTTTKSGRFNYTQIFEETVKATATTQATQKYVNNGREVEYHIERTMEIIGTNMEKTLMFGRKVAPSAGVAGTMDGILPIFSTNVYNKSGAALTQVHLEDALEDIWEAGAKAYLILAGSTQARRIDTFLDPYKEASYQDQTFGSFLTRYRTRFGILDILMSRWMSQSEVWLLDTSKIGFGPLTNRALGITKIATKSREYDEWQISGEYTSETRLEKSHARIYGLATTGLF